VIVIGDVHGCLEELEALLARCGAGAGEAVVLVGDLVAKGPDSQGVVQLARERGLRAVLGNHDDKVLRVRGSGTAGAGPKPEHERVAASLTAADWSWLEALPLSIRLAETTTVVLHAGAVPGIAIEEQKREHLLNLRSITPQGKPSKRIEDGVPWASLWRGPEEIIFGHDAVRGLQRHPLATGLDTGCVYGGSLTALVLPEHRLESVTARRPYAPPAR
jgi:hypothetical protein